MAYEYRSLALTRFIGQPERVKKAAHIIRTHPGFTWSVLAHSNGCAIALRVLDECPDIRLDALHLVAAAAPAHCGVNGLNSIASRRYSNGGGQVNDVHLYVSRRDRALWFGGLSRKLFGWCGLGYGDLGRSGPCNVGDDLDRILHVTQRDELDHCDWLRGENFPLLMRNLTR